MAPIRAVPDPVVPEPAPSDELLVSDERDEISDIRAALFGTEPVAAPVAEEATHAAPVLSRVWSAVDVVKQWLPRREWLSPGQWLPRGRTAIMAAAALVAIGGAAGAFWWHPFGTLRTLSRSVVSAAARAAAPTAPAAPAASTNVVPAVPVFKMVGNLSVSSDPTAARVLVDGKLRGATPVVVENLAPGGHTVVLESPAGSIHRSVTIAAGQTAEISETIFAGWAQVIAPFDVTIAENGRALRLDDRSQVMLPPGRHQLQVQNRVLGYDDVRPVDVTPGMTTTVSIVPPRTTITVTTNGPATVWIDGTPAGDAPATIPVDLGSHEVAVKPAAGASRTFNVTATVKPVRLDVDFSKAS